ncbi:MAG: hypothetical protein ACRDMU_03400 [Gaiellaceae bacterium]
MEPDCPGQLVWEDTRSSAADVVAARLGSRLGTGVLPGCGAPGFETIPDEPVAVHTIRGADPAVAVASVSEDGSRLAWLGGGYLVESPRHPFHGAFYGDQSARDRLADFDCGPPLTARGTALSTPVPQAPTLLRVQAKDAAVEELLRAEGTDRIVSLDAATDLEGLPRRHGVPFVGFGDELTLALRVCDGKESAPGVAGLRLLVAAALAAR